MDEDDDELFRRGRNGDVDAFMLLCARYQRLVFASAFRILRNSDEASEVVQVGVQHAYKGLDTMRDKFGPWFCRIVRNLAIDALRQRKPNLSLDNEDEPLPELVDPRADPARHAADEEVRKRVHSVLGRLTPEHAEVLNLYYLVDQSYDEIGTTLGLSVGTISSRVNRAKENFLKLWTTRL